MGEIEAGLRQHPKLREQRSSREKINRTTNAWPPISFPDDRARPRRQGFCASSFLKDLLPTTCCRPRLSRSTRCRLTPNGKLDRKALPAPDRLRSDSAPVAPRTPLEQQLAAIFASVLKIDRVGIRDNFFDLGGHSFLVLRVLAEIEKACGRRLSVATLFQAPTVEEIGQILTAGDSLDDSDVIVPLNPHGTTPPLFSVWMGIATELREFCRCLGPDQRLYGISSHWDPTQMRMTRIEEMAAFNLTHLRKVQPRGPYYLSSDCVTTLIVLEMAQQLLAQGEEIAALVLIDPPPPRTYMKTPTARDRYRNRVERHLRSLANLNVIKQIAYLLRRVLYYSSVDQNRDSDLPGVQAAFVARALVALYQGYAPAREKQLCAESLCRQNLVYLGGRRYGRGAAPRNSKRLVPACRASNPSHGPRRACRAV